MESLKKNKGAIILLVIIIIGFLVYKYVLPSKEPLTTEESASTAQVIGQDLVNELNRLKSLSRINTGLFGDPIFMNLKDISVPVQARPVGRDNPFLPTS